MKGKLKLSVIIPTCNGASWLDALLASLTSQTVLPDEILLIDSNSSDATCTIIKQYMERHSFIRLEQIAQQDFDHGGTRTLAAQQAIGDILLFMTQDAIPANTTALELLIQPFALDEQVAATYGRQLPAKQATFFAEHLRSFNYPEQSQQRCQQDWATYGFKTVFISNSFAAWRSDILRQQGYFPEQLLFGEDTVALAKMLEKGYKVSYISHAMVYHSHNYSAVQDFKRYFDIGVLHTTQAQHLLQHGGPAGAGRKYVLSELKLLAQKKKYFLLPEACVRNLCKFIAYKVGRKFKMLPTRWSAHLSMHPRWWHKRS
ncbi:MAG: glycosyltransferase family 2 protein [Candidatus Electrothrix sp. AW5]|nr:glycosyltransferase family 2 protein [Candidatus Electrothrix gigas]